MMKNSKTEYITRVMSLLLSAAMLLSLCACSSSVSVSKIKGKPKQVTQPESTLLHSVGAQDNFQKVGESGLIELWFDESTYSVCVADRSHEESEKFWSSLPSEENPSAAAATLEIVNGDMLYLLNTQDNSVSYRMAEYEFADNAITVTYTVVADKVTAQKTEFGKDDIAFKLVINYELKDGSMYVSASYENLAKDSKAKLTRLYLLDSFGSYTEPQNGDYIFVPDGSGALIKTDTSDNSFDSELQFPVYGVDPASGQTEEDTIAARVPAYGMKQGENAFVVIIDGGDAIATVCADRARANNDFYEVGVFFDTTPCAVKKNKYYLSDESYDGEISLCVRFLNGTNATYTGMAAAVREQLIRERVLSTKTYKQDEYLPMDLSVIGVSDDILFSISKLKPRTARSFTSFEQSLDMLMRMKSKGINSIKLRYKGAITGGIDQSDIMSASVLSRVGSSSDFKELYEYIKAQNMEIYLDIDLFSAAKSDAFSSSKTAGSIFGDKAEYNKKNAASDSVGEKSYEKRLLGLNNIEKAIIEILSNSRFTQFSGLCLNDVGSVLYSDYKNGFNRQEGAREISDQLPSLTSNMKLMTDTGNFCIVKSVSFISHLPTSASEERSAYVSIPFVQLVLHGMVGYSCEPLNYSDDIKTAFLRSIEYGADPSFEWTYSASYTDKKNKGEDGENSGGVYYENWIASAADFYERADSALRDVQSARMTSHSEVRTGVFCTEYDTGAKIYVNYTDSDVTVSGITVPAGDFLRIN